MEISLSTDQSEPPVVFISYSWVSEQHKTWVINLARRLRANGIDVRLDRWDVRLGHDLNLFMERYADPSARVIVVLSDDYGPKADQRGQQPSGVATETTIVSATVYRDLGSNRVIPLVPDSGTVAANPLVPAYLTGRNWIDFRGDNETAYEHLLRDLHDAPLEAAPPLGPNPFYGRTEAQATTLIRNDAARWHASSSRGFVEVNLNQNSGQFILGNDEASFKLQLEYPHGRTTRLGGPKRVRHYRDQIGAIGLVAAANDHPECFTDLALLPMSNRVEETNPGDALVMLNEQGYWSILLLDDVVFRAGPNGHEAIALLRYAIATDRTDSLTLGSLPPRGD